ncbi:myelin transcription factor 1-like isoform X1 [Selaginella moellendorffii]|uniref:myelin transcription factor 1-like isoform X1 n=1 Tax=Selaginella moellendorffii TaxID=88036 RepID=UPI000D1CD485|nr:myelin transcription factor 1-like isoform X1 [Selaginella moellendorffii]XP_024526000.1 myelin transcription factor 1-like isoform X1 [Selaginella moellendorffii]XP_024526001.1 myelin transcription factor 1-like isoform X1 [Selaginella moellendorffii]XP_024526002.1 myelin transcription factor 1-like isoform X1 [Selaginella moellendorffii]|eukprot:XP_024525999.1 myelin transcription factor 1-like isoform X1 [Selaginella moellendorffii]
MADGSGGEAALAMAEVKRRARDEIAGDAAAGGKRLRATELFDEPLAAASRPSPGIKHQGQENGVSIRDEEFATAEVVNASRSGSASAAAVEDFGEEEDGLRSDVEEEEEEEFVDETESDEVDDEEEEGDYTDEDDYSDVELQLSGAQNRPRRIEKGIVLDKGKNKAAAAVAPPQDYKGKGKAIVQEEDSSSDDSEVGVDEDEFLKANMAALRDADALEEVDLNNILPTRTRRRTIQQPVHCDDPGNGSSEEDEDYVAGGELGTPGGGGGGGGGK